MKTLFTLLFMILLTGLAKAQNVGIGTPTPAGKLHVVTTESNGDVVGWGTGQLVIGGNGTQAGALGLSYSNTNNTGYISALSPNIAWRNLGFRSKNTVFYYNGTFEGMRLDSTGNVGLGITNPLMGLHIAKADSAVALLENTQALNLNISNALYFKTGSGTFPYTGALKTIGQSSYEARLGLFSSASATANGLQERLSITDFGNVGIGNTAPDDKLHVLSTTNVRIAVEAQDAGFAGIRFKNNMSEFYTGIINDRWTVFDNFVGQDRISLLPNGNVGIGTPTPAPSALLDVSSTTKGFLPPRMTSTQRDALTPAEGLMIYNTTTKKPSFYNGVEWRNFDDTFVFAIGDNYQGGIIAYILQSGDAGYSANQTHGLIATASDQSIGAEWGCYGTALSGAAGTALGTGNQNTIDIMAGCTISGIAARLCGNLVLNGFSDWYLPSTDELNKLYINRVVLGGFASGVYYWSSSQFDLYHAWGQLFDNDEDPITSLKYNVDRVRAVRAF